MNYNESVQTPRDLNTRAYLYGFFDQSQLVSAAESIIERYESVGISVTWKMIDENPEKPELFE